MNSTVLALRFGRGRRDVATIQQALDGMLDHLRHHPPRLDADGRLVVDLSALTGQPPVDLATLVPGIQPEDLDVESLRAEVGLTARGMGVGAGDLVIALGSLAVLAAIGATVHDLRITGGPLPDGRPRRALMALWDGALADGLRRLAGRDALGHRAGGVALGGSAAADPAAALGDAPGGGAEPDPVSCPES